MTGPENEPRATGARYWPDRKAHRHRRRAHQAFIVLALLALVAPWLGYRHLRDALHAPVSPSAASPSADARAGSAADARPADTPAAAAAPTPIPTPMRQPRAAEAAVDAEQRAPAAADRTIADALPPLTQFEHAVERTAARDAVQRLPGVRAAGWIDRSHLLVVAARSDLRSEAMIDVVCARIGRIGDADGVVVSVRDGSAARGPQARELGRGCHAPEKPAVLQAPPPRRSRLEALRAQMDADSMQGVDDPERRARNEESMRILEETTPEM